MSKKDLKFSEYPFKVPSKDSICKKLEGLLAELKECKDAQSAAKVINRWNKYGTKLQTQGSLIYVMYSLNTNVKKYVNAQAKMDEISPVISNYSNMYAKILTSAPYRKDLEKKYSHV